jgi:hypothetical protein
MKNKNNEYQCVSCLKIYRYKRKSENVRFCYDCLIHLRSVKCGYCGKDYMPDGILDTGHCSSCESMAHKRGWYWRQDLDKTVECLSANADMTTINKECYYLATVCEKCGEQYRIFSIGSENEDGYSDNTVLFYDSHVCSTK